MRRPTAAALFCAAVAGLSACGPGQEGPATRIVLITVDTLRKDAWDEGPEGRTSMPLFLERASSGLVFERAYSSSSSTQPTHVSLFTGMQPWEHGVSRNGLRIGAEVELLAERLERAGFESHAVVSSFPVSSVYGFDRGFASYDDEFNRSMGDGTWNEQELESDGFYSLGDDITERALAALERARGRRQFLWVHYFDPHDPYGDSHRVPVESEGGATRPRTVKELDVATLRGAARERDTRLPKAVQLARSLYVDDVERMDGWLERLMARLEADSGEFETHVVITSDHGESFGEDGSLGHGHRVTPPQVHVPLAILSPRVLAPAVRTDPCGSIDVHATLLDLAGLEPVAGRSLLAEPAKAQRAFGMRRTFAERRLDSRLDGSTPAMDEAQFFVASEGSFLVGNGRGLESGAASDAAVLGLFEAFEAELATRQAVEVQDEASLEALRNLGYAR